MSKKILPLLLLALLVLTLPLVVFLVQQRWVPKKAVELPSPIIFSPTQGEFAVGETFTVNLFLNTEGQPIDGLDLVVVVHNLDITAEIVSLPEGLTFIKEPEVFEDKVKFSILAQPSLPFANSEPVLLINFNLSGRVSCQNSSLAIDKNFSVVASSGQNILGEPIEPNFVIKTPEGVTNPEFTSEASVNAALGQDFSYTATATNPNNGILEFSFYNLPDFLAASGPVIGGTPDQIGVYLIDIEVIDGQGGSACASLVLLVFDPTPIEITEVQADPGFNKATTTWKTNRETTSQVEYGKTVDYGQTTSLSEDLVENHIVVLDSLSEASTYHFRVKSSALGVDEAVSADYIFTTLAMPAKTLNIMYQFQGKKENQNNHFLTIWAKDTDFKHTFFGDPNGSFLLDIEDILENSDQPYEILLKGYQNLTVKRTIAIRDGVNPPSGHLDFGQLSCGDIAPASNTDNMVNSLDWGYMVDEWNLEESKFSVADINDDERVNSLDYSLFISRFGLTGEE